MGNGTQKVKLMQNQSLMDTENCMKSERMSALMAGFEGKRVVVVGDIMLDEYIWGQTNRISPEAPVMVVEAKRQSQVPGGAANVVNNLCALGAIGIVIGAVGDDESGRALTAALQGKGADTTGVIVLTDRPTTRKTRIVAHSQQVVRVDYETQEPLDEGGAGRLGELLEELVPGADAILISDYQKGVISPELLRVCVRLSRLYEKPLMGNLKPSMLREGCGLTMITLNLLEASQAVGRRSLETDDKLQAAGKALLERTGAENMVITQGARGLTVFSACTPNDPLFVPAQPVEVFDPAGAGDTVISTMTLALVAGASPAEAAILATHAAAAAVKKLGVSTVTRTEITDSFQRSCEPTALVAAGDLAMA